MIIQPQLPDDPKTAAALQQILDVLNGQLDKDNFTGVLPFPLSPVAALPSPAADGQLCLFQSAAMEAAGVPPWLLRYRAKNRDGTVNANASKWEPLGAPVPLYNEVDTAESTAALGYGDLTTVGPALTPPLTGVYDIDWGNEAWNNTAGSQSNESIVYNGAAATDTDRLNHTESSGGNTGASPGSRPRRYTLTAGQAVTCKYRVTAGTGSFRNRWLRLAPVRVG